VRRYQTVWHEKWAILRKILNIRSRVIELAPAPKIPLTALSARVPKGGSYEQPDRKEPTRDCPRRSHSEEIELCAYQIYIERGGAHGQDVEDWVQAERELVEKYGNPVQRAKAVAV